MVFSLKKYAIIFSGLLIAICIIASSHYIKSQQNRLKQDGIINNPLVNDLYIVNYKLLFSDFDPIYKYGVMKIERMNDRKIEFIISTVSYQKVSSVERDIRKKDIEKKDYFDHKPLHIKMKNIKELRVLGTIKSVSRYPVKTNP